MALPLSRGVFRVELAIMHEEQWHEECLHHCKDSPLLRGDCKVELDIIHGEHWHEDSLKNAFTIVRTHPLLVTSHPTRGMSNEINHRDGGNGGGYFRGKDMAVVSR